MCYVLLFSLMVVVSVWYFVFVVKRLFRLVLGLLVLLMKKFVFIEVLMLVFEGILLFVNGL